MLRPNAQCATLSLPSALLQHLEGCRDCNRRARVPMLLCPLDFFLFFFSLFRLCVCRSFGSPVVLVTRRSSGPSQLLQMVKKKKKKKAQEGERGGSVVITSWLGGSAKAACKTSAATGTRGCECRLLGGPRCLRGQVLVLVCFCLRERFFFFFTDQYGTCVTLACMAIAAHQRSRAHVT